MSTFIKLTDYDPKVLLPNPPPEPELTLEQQAAAFEAYAASHNNRIRKG